MLEQFIAGALVVLDWHAIVQGGYGSLILGLFLCRSVHTVLWVAQCLHIQ